MVKYIKRTYTVEITHRVELPDDFMPHEDYTSNIISYAAPDYEKSPLTDIAFGKKHGWDAVSVSLSDIDVEKTGESITGKGGENDPNVAIYAALDAREMELGV